MYKLFLRLFCVVIVFLIPLYFWDKSKKFQWEITPTILWYSGSLFCSGIQHPSIIWSFFGGNDLPKSDTDSGEKCKCVQLRNFFWLQTTLAHHGQKVQNEIFTCRCFQWKIYLDNDFSKKKVLPIICKGGKVFFKSLVWKRQPNWS